MPASHVLVCSTLLLSVHCAVQFQACSNSKEHIFMMTEPKQESQQSATDVTAVVPPADNNANLPSPTTPAGSSTSAEHNDRTARQQGVIWNLSHQRHQEVLAPAQQQSTFAALPQLSVTPVETAQPSGASFAAAANAAQQEGQWQQAQQQHVPQHVAGEQPVAAASPTQDTFPAGSCTAIAKLLNSQGAIPPELAQQLYAKIAARLNAQCQGTGMLQQQPAWNLQQQLQSVEQQTKPEQHQRQQQSMVHSATEVNFNQFNTTGTNMQLQQRHDHTHLSPADGLHRQGKDEAQQQNQTPRAQQLVLGQCSPHLSPASVATTEHDDDEQMSPVRRQQQDDLQPLASVNDMDSMSQNGQQQDAGRRSNYRGLTWDKKDGRWRVRIHWRGKQHHVGRFTDELQAAQCFDSAAYYLFRSRAVTNFGIPAAAASTCQVPANIKLLLQQDASQGDDLAAAAAPLGCTPGLADRLQGLSVLMPAQQGAQQHQQRLQQQSHGLLRSSSGVDAAAQRPLPLLFMQRPAAREPNGSRLTVRHGYFSKSGSQQQQKLKQLFRSQSLNTSAAAEAGAAAAADTAGVSLDQQQTQQQEQHQGVYNSSAAAVLDGTPREQRQAIQADAALHRMNLPAELQMSAANLSLPGAHCRTEDHQQQQRSVPVPSVMADAGVSCSVAGQAGDSNHGTNLLSHLAKALQNCSTAEVLKDEVLNDVMIAVEKIQQQQSIQTEQRQQAQQQLLPALISAAIAKLGTNRAAVVPTPKAQGAAVGAGLCSPINSGGLAGYNSVSLGLENQLMTQLLQQHQYQQLLLAQGTADCVDKVRSIRKAKAVLLQLLLQFGEQTLAVDEQQQQQEQHSQVQAVQWRDQVQQLLQQCVQQQHTDGGGVLRPHGATFPAPAGAVPDRLNTPIDALHASHYHRAMDPARLAALSSPMDWAPLKSIPDRKLATAQAANTPDQSVPVPPPAAAAAAGTASEAQIMHSGSLIGQKRLRPAGTDAAAGGEAAEAPTQQAKRQQETDGQNHKPALALLHFLQQAGITRLSAPVAAATNTSTGAAVPPAGPAMQASATQPAKAVMKDVQPAAGASDVVAALTLARQLTAQHPIEGQAAAAAVAAAADTEGRDVEHVSVHDLRVSSGTANNAAAAVALPLERILSIPNDQRQQLQQRKLQLSNLNGSHSPATPLGAAAAAVPQFAGRLLQLSEVAAVLAAQRQTKAVP